MTSYSVDSAIDRGYAPAGDLEMYYEVHGEGSPLVLLHGGLTTIATSFGAILPALAEHRTIFAIEQQGHGRTRDIDRPFSFAQMADDTAAALRFLGVESAEVFGYSDGGNVALGLAIRHPDLVRKVIVAGTNFNTAGLQAEMLELMKHATADQMPGELQDAYTSVAPDPDNWPTLVQKTMSQTLEFPGWSEDELRSIKSPALVIVGDTDIVRLEHAEAMVREIPNARLLTLEGVGHMVPSQAADRVGTAILEHTSIKTTKGD